MAKKIKINDLSKEIQSILKTYSDEVIDDTKKAVDEVTKESLKITKSHAPVDERAKKRKGKYKRSLKSKTKFEGLTEKKNVIYASGGEHRLTHLLERGHAKVNGGRTKAIPHFSYGEQYAIEELPKRIKNKIQGGK